MLYLQVVGCTLAIYVFLIAMVGVFGRRTLGQLSSLDLVVLLLLGSAVETSMIHGNTALKAGLVSAATLFAANRLLAVLIVKVIWVRRLLCPDPVLLVHEGEIQEASMKRLGITHSDLLEALRSRECADVKEVRFAVLEPDGQIHIATHSST